MKVGVGIVSLLGLWWFLAVGLGFHSLQPRHWWGTTSAKLNKSDLCHLDALKCKNRDLAILHFGAEQDVDFCKEAYLKGAQTYTVNGNAVTLTPADDTDSYEHECDLSGDIAQTATCEVVYVTRLGVVCALGAHADLIAFRHSVSVTDMTEGVINHYRPDNYDFAMQCGEHSIETNWQLAGAETLHETIHLHRDGYVTEVISKDNKQFLSHRFNKHGDYYEVVNLARLVENPQSRQTTWQFYQPSVVKLKKFAQSYFWVNYLGSLMSCCDDQQCKKDFQDVEFLKSRQPAEEK